MQFPDTQKTTASPLPTPNNKKRNTFAKGDNHSRKNGCIAGSGVSPPFPSLTSFARVLIVNWISVFFLFFYDIAVICKIHCLSQDQEGKEQQPPPGCRHAGRSREMLHGTVRGGKNRNGKGEGGKEKWKEMGDFPPSPLSFFSFREMRSGGGGFKRKSSAPSKLEGLITVQPWEVGQPERGETRRLWSLREMLSTHPRRHPLCLRGPA